jgi:hypothetical protein
MSDVREESGHVRPITDDEQVIVARIYRTASSMKNKNIVGVGMGPGLIEDLNAGRWTRIFGWPVVEIKGQVPRSGSDPNLLVLLVEVPQLPEGETKEWLP